MAGQSIQVGPFVGGLNTYSDPTAIADNELVVCDNWDIDMDGSLKSRPPFVDNGIHMPLQATGNAHLLGYFYDDAGGAFLLGSDGNSRTYYFDGTSWASVTTTFAATAVVQFDGKAWLVAPEGSTNPGGYWVPGAGFTPVPNMPKGDTIVAYRERLFIAKGRSATSQGTRLYRSATIVEVPNTLWPAIPLWNEIGTGDGENIVALAVQYNMLLVFRTRSVWSYSFLSDPASFVTSLVVPGVGLNDKDALVAHESFLYWMYEDRAYEFSNNRAQQINQKAPFETTGSTSVFYAPFTVSEFNRRIIFSYYGTMYVFSLRNRTWTTWHSPAYGGIGRIIKIDSLGETVAAITHSSQGVPAGGTRQAATLSITDEYSDEAEAVPFPCTLQTKNFNYEASSVYKRLYWWGVDATFDGQVTGTVTPIVYNYTVSWGTLLLKGSWEKILTWGQPLIDGLSVVTVRDTTGSAVGRKFLKFNKGLRFRQVNFKLAFVSNGSAESPARIFNLSTFVAAKERVSKTIT